MNAIKSLYQRILSSLRIRIYADGLEISDQVLRLAYLDGDTWKMEAVRLAPGTMDKGKINDAPAFDAALRELRSKVPAMKGTKKKMNIFVALSSVNMYSQVFTLPSMEGGDFEKAVNLNVQMLAPMDITKAYFGWQVVGRDEKTLRSEIAVAFADKETVNEITQALYTAGFIIVGIESRALAVVRALREKGGAIDQERSYLLIDIDNSGIDFLIVRNGKLYFEYMNPWTDIADEKGQMSVVKFEETLSASVRQVFNFYSQHWPEPLADIILSAVAFEAEARHAIADLSAALPVIPLTLTIGQEISPEWLVAFGCGLRGLHSYLRDKEINLSGSGATDTFYDERMFDFLALWRVLIPVVLGCFIIMYGIADYLLIATTNSIESSPAFAQQAGEVSDVAALEASSTAFNQSITLIASAEGQINKNYRMIADINTVATANSVTVNNISFPAANAPILVAGTAATPDQISAFKNAIQSDPHFGVVSLPLANVQQSGGVYTFSMTFLLSSVGF